MSGLADALLSFYRGRRVLVTGHTGFKGSWLTLWLRKMGATVTGLALPPESPLAVFGAAGLASPDDRFLDVRDLQSLRRVFDDARPEIVFHLAAQAIVGIAHRDPVTTFDTNIMGCVNVLECVRSQPGVVAVVIVTSDKCYENVEQIWGYRETDRLGGHEPYGASKAAAEIVTSAFSGTFFEKVGSASVASARAGNVVGGGDWSEFRLVPDCIRSLRAGMPIPLRHPQATRPWQFVLEPLGGYLLLGMRLVTDGKRVQGAWNFGPFVDNSTTVDRGARAIADAWGGGSIQSAEDPGFRESTLLQLDCAKAQRFLGWRPVLGFDETMQLTAQWYKHQHETGDASMRDFSLSQLDSLERRLNREVRT